MSNIVIQYVEDALEILHGTRPRAVNVRIDYTDRKIIKSIVQQISNNIGLTDRQLDLVLKKLKKYQQGLEKNNINVEELIVNKHLRLPMRELDRTQRIYFNPETPKSFFIKFNYSKEFATIWDSISTQISNIKQTQGTVKQVPLTETNVYNVLVTLRHLDFIVDDFLLDIFNKLKEIKKNPFDYIPYADINNGLVVIKNVNTRCLTHIEAQKPAKSMYAYLDNLKSYGILAKTETVIEEINKSQLTSLTKQVLLESATRIRVLPDKHTLADIIDVIDLLDQWPLVVLVDEQPDPLNQVTNIYNLVKNKVENKNITVFFRLSSETPNSDKFNSFIKEHSLNNFIDENTKIVFISRNKIPKPLLRANWKPKAAILTGTHDFGKTSIYLDGISKVYYYNSSSAIRLNRIKGTNKIVEL